MPTRRAALGMFAILLFSYIINAIDRQLFSVLASDVRLALNLTLPQTGLASTVFTLGMGLAGLPTGYLLSRVSRKNVVLIGLVVFSVATFLTAYAQGLPDLLLYRFVSGLGEAMQLTALLAIGVSYFHQHRAIAASSLNFTFGIGAIIGPNLGAAILGLSHWQMPFIVFGLSGFLALALIIPCVKPWFSEASAPTVTSTPDSSHSNKGIWDKTPLLLALATACAGLSIYGYLGLYPTYLREALGFSPQQAAVAISCYGLGALLSLLGGWLGDHVDFRKLLIVALLISAIFGGLLFTELNRSLPLHAALSFAFGAAISGMVYANLSAGIIKSVDAKLAAQASGLFVASLYIPAAFAGYLLGLLKTQLDWSAAGIVQISGCALAAAALTAAIPRPPLLRDNLGNNA